MNATTTKTGAASGAKASRAEPSSAEKVARACYQAYVDKDRAAIEALIADDFLFSSPLDNGLDRQTYFERCWPNSQQMKSFEYITVAPDGDDRVFVLYEGTTFDGHRFRNTERLTVRNGKLVEVEVYFGWSIPHEAKPGGFIDQASKESDSDVADDERQIRSLVSDWMEATKRGDTSAILNLMTDDALFLQPGRPPMDKAAFEKQSVAQSKARPETVGNAKSPTIEGKSDIEELVVSGDWAFARSRLQITITSPDGSHRETRTGNAMSVFKKEGTTWRLARDANLLAGPS
jgi:uncharacterized protein (TIGR02246 family)